MEHYSHFILPFSIGVAVLFATVAWKWVTWFTKMPRGDRALAGKKLLSGHTLAAVGEIFSESLLHRRIFRVNPLLGYMHMSLALGWFLLILAGWAETTWHLEGGAAPLHTHIFFKYFFGSDADHSGGFFPLVMDLLLLFVLSGVALAWFKRFRSRTLGMRRTTKHTTGDRVALSALWFIFPARLLAESTTCGIYGGGSFLTGGLGSMLAGSVGTGTLQQAEPAAWWAYSLALGVFFVAMPFSRYMHIFTEIPLIFMRRWGIGSRDSAGSFDRFQIEACSRCGLCIDPCQLMRDAGVDTIQSVYFLRDVRYGKLTETVADNCLMCGRCEVRCPVGIELNTLRQNRRHALHNTPAGDRYTYIGSQDRSGGEGRVGYFAGCMTMLTPRILRAMEQIFTASGENVWWADRDGGVCCGRPLKLSGEIDAARRMMDYNAELFQSHGITTLVTSCPICLKVFREDYDLAGIEVLHHSQYISRLLAEGRLEVLPDSITYTYHDPCELGRGAGIYDPPREVIASVGHLVEPVETRENAMCCGSSIADIVVSDGGQEAMSRGVAAAFSSTGADAVVTACPLCKKAIARTASQPVYDLAEIVAANIAGRA